MSEEQQLSPTSSPPPMENERATGGSMLPPPSRKPSSEQVEHPDDEMLDSSATIVSDATKTKDRGNEGQVSSTNMQPPPTPTQDNVTTPMTPASVTNVQAQTATQPSSSATMAPLSTKPPQSAQKPAEQKRTQQPKPKKQSKAETAAKPARPAEPVSHKRSNEHITREEKPDDSDSDATVTESNPAESMNAFDWEDLQRRYHEQMKAFSEKEVRIWDEFDDLSNVGSSFDSLVIAANQPQFFGIWAQTSQTHETDRSFKRCVERDFVDDEVSH